MGYSLKKYALWGVIVRKVKSRSKFTATFLYCKNNISPILCEEAYLG